MNIYRPRTMRPRYRRNSGYRTTGTGRLLLLELQRLLFCVASSVAIVAALHFMVK